MPVRSYSVRMKRRNREAVASFRKNQSRRKLATSSPSTHAPARRTVSAGATLPSEEKPARSPSTKSVSSEPGASTSKDLKFETLVEEEQEDKESPKEEKEKEKPDEEKGELGDDEKKEEGTTEKAHVTFQEPEEKEEEEGEPK